MKFLGITSMSDSYATLPPDVAMRVMEGGAAFIDKYRKAGKCKEIYNVPGLKMGVSIWEVESAEEMTRLFLENPSYPFMDVETYILSDWDTMTRAWKEGLERRAAATKK